jgi:hypothetical protein
MKLSGSYEINYRIWIDTVVLFIACIIWLQALDQEGKLFIDSSGNKILLNKSKDFLVCQHTMQEVQFRYSYDKEYLCIHLLQSLQGPLKKKNVFLISKFSLAFWDFPFMSKEQRSVFVVFKWKCFPSLLHILPLLLLLLLPHIFQSTYTGNAAEKLCK